MASVLTQYGASMREVANAARLRNAQMSDSNSNRDQDYVDRLQGSISRATQEIEDERIREFAKKQELGVRRRLDEARQKVEEDRFVRDVAEVYEAYKANKFMVPLHAIRTAMTSRQAIRNLEEHSWTLPFMVAIGMDGLFSLIPVVGSFLLGFGWVYLFIFLWGTGTKMKVYIWRFLLWLAMFFGFCEVFIPFMKLLTFSTVIVYIYYRSFKKKHEKEKNKLEAIQQEFPSLVVE